MDPQLDLFGPEATVGSADCPDKPTEEAERCSQLIELPGETFEDIFRRLGDRLCDWGRFAREQ